MQSMEITTTRYSSKAQDEFKQRGRTLIPLDILGIKFAFWKAVVHRIIMKQKKKCGLAIRGYIPEDILFPAKINYRA